jgi:hypothetical protein
MSSHGDASKAVRRLDAVTTSGPVDDNAVGGVSNDNAVALARKSSMDEVHSCTGFVLRFGKDGQYFGK